MSAFVLSFFVVILCDCCGQFGLLEVILLPLKLFCITFRDILEETNDVEHLLMEIVPELQEAGNTHLSAWTVATVWLLYTERM